MGLNGWCRSQPGGCHQRQTHLLPERSPARSTTATSDIRGCFRSRLERLGHWMEEQKHWPLTQTTFCLPASNKKDFELMVKECIAGFSAASLETGMNKAFWTSTVRSPTASLNIDSHSIPWSEKNRICRFANLSLQQQRLSEDKQTTKSHGSVREVVQHTLRRIPGSDKAHPSVSALQSGMAERLLTLANLT